MSTKELPTRPRQTVVVEWVYIKTRTLVLLGGIVIGALGWGGWYWYSTSRAADVRAQAAAAIEEAERAISDAAIRAPQAPDLVQARDYLARAQRAFASQDFGRAVEDAREAEQHAGAAMAPGAAETDTGARLVHVRGEVHLKRSGQFVWEPVSAKTILKAGDQLRTAGDGSADVVYFDGTRVTLSNHSMLEIRELYRDPMRREQRVEERLVWGTLNALTTESEGTVSVHHVSTEEASFKARQAAEFEVRRGKDGGKSQVTTYAGQVSMTTGGREVEVPESTQVTVAEGRIVERVQLVDPPRLTSPPDGKSFALAEQAAIALVWVPIERAGRYRLQVSSTANFTTPAIDLELVITSAELPDLAVGLHYWRVASIDASGRIGRWSESRKFKLLGADYRDLDDRTPPTLNVTEVLVVGTNAIVSGGAEPGALVWIDGERVDVDDHGKFTWVVKLREDGLNNIQFLVQDAAGNETRQIRQANVDVF